MANYNTWMKISRASDDWYLYDFVGRYYSPTNTNQYDDLDLDASVMTSVIIHTQACRDATVALSSQRYNYADMLQYMIIIGAENNTFSTIRSDLQVYCYLLTQRCIY